MPLLLKFIPRLQQAVLFIANTVFCWIMLKNGEKVLNFFFCCVLGALHLGNFLYINKDYLEESISMLRGKNDQKGESGSTFNEEQQEEKNLTL